MTDLFKLSIPTPQEIINNGKVDKHINPGWNPQEVIDREHKSMFDPVYTDRNILHVIITAVEPCRTGEKRYSDFLMHSVNHLDSWSFVFSQPTLKGRNPGRVRVGEIQFPDGTIYYQKNIKIIFFESSFITMFPMWSVV